MAADLIFSGSLAGLPEVDRVPKMCNELLEERNPYHLYLHFLRANRFAADLEPAAGDGGAEVGGDDFVIEGAGGGAEVGGDEFDVEGTDVFDDEDRPCDLCGEERETFFWRHCAGLNFLCGLCESTVSTTASGTLDVDPNTVTVCPLCEGYHYLQELCCAACKKTHDLPAEMGGWSQESLKSHANSGATGPVALVAQVAGGGEVTSATETVRALLKATYNKFHHLLADAKTRRTSLFQTVLSPLPDSEGDISCELGKTYKVPDEYASTVDSYYGPKPVFNVALAARDPALFAAELGKIEHPKSSKRKRSNFGIHESRQPQQSQTSAFEHSLAVGNCHTMLRVSCPGFAGWNPDNFTTNICVPRHVVFTPSYRRSKSALLNRGEANIENIVTVVVVRAAEFDKYAKRWGKDCVIIGLDAEVTTIGKTWQRILDVAHTLQLEHCWMMDDTVIPTTLTTQSGHDQLPLVDYLDEVGKGMVDKVVLISAASAFSSASWAKQKRTPAATHTRTPTAIVRFNVRVLFEKTVYYFDLPSKEDVLFANTCTAKELAVAVDREFSYKTAALGYDAEDSSSDDED